MQDRDRFIAAQNAASVAATLLAAAGVTEMTAGMLVAEFDTLRTYIFEGTMRLAEVPVAAPLTEEQGAQIIHGNFPGTTEDPFVVVQQTHPSYPRDVPPAPPAPQIPPPAPQAGPAGGAVCPKCGGGMWDNRASKKNPKAPDFRCKDNGCDGVVWPPRGR